MLTRGSGQCLRSKGQEEPFSRYVLTMVLDNRALELYAELEDTRVICYLILGKGFIVNEC